MALAFGSIFYKYAHAFFSTIPKVVGLICLVTEIGEYRLGELPAPVTRPPAFFHSFAAEQFFNLPSGFLCRLDKVRVSLLLL